MNEASDYILESDLRKLHTNAGGICWIHNDFGT